MPRKKEKRVRRADSPVRWFIKQNRRWIRRIGVVAALLVAGIALWFIVDPLQGPPTAVTETGEEISVGIIDTPGAAASTGSPAPNFVLPDYDERAVTLDQFEGKIVLVNFWASWCTFCDEEMPDLFELAQRFPDDVVLLAVNRGESRGTAKGWSDARSFPDLPNVHWLLDESEEVTDEYRVSGMPQSFFIDRGGNVHQELRRVTEFAEIQETVLRLLGDDQAAGG